MPKFCKFGRSSGSDLELGNIGKVLIGAILGNSLHLKENLKSSILLASLFFSKSGKNIYTSFCIMPYNTEKSCIKKKNQTP